MRRFLTVTEGVAWRSAHNAFTNPAFLLPSLAFPLFFLAAFAGGLSAIGNVPGFDYEPGYTAFQYVLVFIQSAAFGGVFQGFAIARDFENGFAQRMMLAAPNRGGLIAGYAVADTLALWSRRSSAASSSRNACGSLSPNLSKCARICGSSASHASGSTRSSSSRLAFEIESPLVSSDPGAGSRPIAVSTASPAPVTRSNTHSSTRLLSP